MDETFYKGTDYKAPSKAELKAWKQVKKNNMPNVVAEKVFNGLSSRRRFGSREEFVRCVAALASLFPGELRRKVAGTKSTVHKLLVRITQPARAEWLLNHQRQRQILSRTEARMAAIGTTSNEALHTELNRWFRTIVEMHQPTLQTKLQIFQLFKLLTHNAALYHPTTIQMEQTVVAGRVVSATMPFNADEEWRAHCAAPPEPQTKRKKVKNLLKTWRQRKGKGRRRMRTQPKRSVFKLYKAAGLWRRAARRKAMRR